MSGRNGVKHKYSKRSPSVFITLEITTRVSGLLFQELGF